jgi:hypothetical protein
MLAPKNLKAVPTLLHSFGRGKEMPISFIVFHRRGALREAFYKLFFPDQIDKASHLWTVRLPKENLINEEEKAPQLESVFLGRIQD